MKDQEKISKFWGEQFSKTRKMKGYWVNNQIVEKSIYRKIGKTTKHWLDWLLQDYFKDRKFKNALSIGCGDGSHEIKIAKSKIVKHIKAFDISSASIKTAQKTFEKELIDPKSYQFRVIDVRNIKDHFKKEKFDLIFCIGSLHHIPNLEELFKKIINITHKNSHIIILEYVGPSQFQWTDRQLYHINKILKNLSPAYLNNPKQKMNRPTIEEMNAIDPSEAIRSEEIYPLVKKNLDIIYEKNYNGTIMHQLYPLLNHSYANQKNKGFDSVIKMILLYEDTLIKKGILKSDFKFMICNKKSWYQRLV